MLRKFDRCPLGEDCEVAKKDGEGKEYLSTCRWYQKTLWEHPKTGEVAENWGCAVSSGPALLKAVARSNKIQTKAIEELRNETEKGNTVFGKIMAKAVEIKGQETNIKEREVLIEQHKASLLPTPAEEIQENKT